MKKTKQTILPKLRSKPSEIVNLLYRYRYLSRIHIQLFLHHKHHSRITTWLNDLTKKTYITMYYEKTFASVPAVYSLGVEGRTYLKLNRDKFKNVNSELLDRVWREDEFTLDFRNRCLLLADICLSLETLVRQTKAKLHFYTQTDLKGTKYLIVPNPWAYFVIDEANGNIKRYFLEIFDDRPSVFARKRVNQYFTYYDAGYWQDHTNKEFPEIILVCPTKRAYSHLYHVIERKLDRNPDLIFYLSTWDEMKSKGLCRETLHKVEAKQ